MVIYIAGNDVAVISMAIDSIAVIITCSFFSLIIFITALLFFTKLHVMSLCSRQ